MSSQQQSPPLHVVSVVSQAPVTHRHSASTAEAVTPDASAAASASHRSMWQHMTRTVAHYKRLEQIGLGTYGQVYRAECLDTGRMVAMKKMRIMTGRGFQGMPLQLIREIKILKQLQHPNLLQMIEVVTSKGVEHLDPDDPIATEEPSKKRKDKYDTGEDGQVVLARERYKGNLFLVLEYVTHDLTGLMDIQYQFTPVQIKCIFQQLLKALQFMHENKYVHRDIKSSNILLTEHFRLKLADFGLARSLEPPLLDQMEDGAGGASQDLTNKVITLWYRPPEVLLGTVNYGCAVDVWSAGCILIELLSGKPLAAGKTELDQLTLLAELTGTPDDETWSYLMSLKKSKSLDENIPPVAAEMRDGERKQSRLRNRYGPNSKNKARQNVPETALNLLDKLLEWDPRKRLTASFALQNRFFWTQPVPPEDPAELGRINVAVDGHFHEFQTKQRRKEAKLVAEMARDNALLNGDGPDAAGAVFDKTYTDIMKKVAQEGLNAVTTVAPAPTDKLTADDGRKEERKSRHRSDEKDPTHRSTNRGDRDRSRLGTRDEERKHSSRGDRDRLAEGDSSVRKSASGSHGSRDRSRVAPPDEQDPNSHKTSVGGRGDREYAHGAQADKDDPNARHQSRSDGERHVPMDDDRARVPSEHVNPDLDDEENRRRRREQKRRRDRHGENDDTSQHSSEKRRHKEKRRRSEDETKERRDREGRSRKDSTGEADFKEGERVDSPRIDGSITSSKDRRSGKRNRRESGGSSGKKDRDKSREHGDRKSGEKREKDRRHKDKRRSRHDRDRDRGTDNNMDSYQRPNDSFGPGRSESERRDRGPARGDDSVGHYGPSGGRVEPRDGPRNPGPAPDEGRDGRGPSRHSRDIPPPQMGYYGPSGRDRDDPGPMFRRGDRDPGPNREDAIGASRRSEREGLPHRNDFASGSRNDRDGTSHHRGRDGPPPLFRGEQGAGPWHGRDGPGRHDDYDPRREREGPPREREGPPRDREGPPRDREGPPRDREGPPRGEYGSGGGGSGAYHPRRDGPFPQRGPDYDRRGEMPPPSRGGPDFGSPQRRHDDRRRQDGRRDRER